MTETEILTLLKNYRNGTLSDEDKDKLEAWYLFEASNSKLRLNEYQLENSYKYLRAKLPIKQEPKVINLWKRVAVAASIALMLATGLYYFRGTTKSEIQLTEDVKEITPGGNRGVLTLSNGKQIVLADVEVNDSIVNDGDNEEVTIQMNPNGLITYVVNPKLNNDNNNFNAFNTLSTPIGGQYNVVLADGTKVYLNAVSSIKYPTQFNEDKRIVELEGEAYFEVSKDKNKPFIVKSRNQTIEVLGTHFNVHSYNNESFVKTTLLEGSVAVSFKDQRAILKPGQQSSVTEDAENILINNVDAESTIAWKDGRFKFDNADLKTVMNQLERWYNIQVEYKGDIPDLKFNGGTFMNKNLSEVLKVLELSNIKFEISGNTIFVYP
ncbi:FecR family protein [Aestuariibaculum marinum]|uniref:FecR domain-containing protein n=1 Tax=Aestuariibaculum marinum TaxID=2683592 RepID=A0A8J6UB72_9FLAO|nr:FecR domain-containing protein [Aestuariibaculum marinum]MBD0825446.1 FecR domain-containing protein [Aestuariibaculum marinum]